MFPDVSSSATVDRLCLRTGAGTAILERLAGMDGSVRVEAGMDDLMGADAGVAVWFASRTFAEGLRARPERREVAVTVAGTTWVPL